MSSLSQTKYSPRAAKESVHWRFLLLVARIFPLLKGFACLVLGSLALDLAAAFIFAGFPLRVLTSTGEFVGAHLALVLLPVAGYLILFFAAWVGHREKDKRRRLKAAFRICTPAEELSPEQLGFRFAHPEEPEYLRTDPKKPPFFGTYFHRKARELLDTMSSAEDIDEDADEDTEIKHTEEDLAQLLREGRRFLLVDAPYAGKTMTLFHILSRMTGYTVVSPNDSQKVLDEGTFDLLKDRKIVILLDNINAVDPGYDIHHFAELIEKATNNCYGIAGTCRDGADFTSIMSSPTTHIAQFFEMAPTFRLSLMTADDRVKLAATTGMQLSRPEAHQSYPLPGNITMRGSTQRMVHVFRSLDSKHKDTLRAMKLLYAGGVFITPPRIRAVLLDAFGQNMDPPSIADILQNLKEQHFLLKDPSTGSDCYHFGYLKDAVSYEEGFTPGKECWEHLAQVMEKTRDVQGLLYLGHNHCRLGDLDRALRTVDAALRIDANNAHGHFQRGYMLARLRRLDEASEANKQALGIYEEALKASKQAWSIRPEYAKALNNGGYILARLRKWKEAEDTLRRALELSPNFADAHTNLAIVFAYTGRIQQAIQEIHAALSLRQENYYAYLNLGIILSRDNDFDGALNAYAKALKLWPNSPEVYFNRGVTLAKSGRLAEALVAHDEAIKRRGNYVEAHMHRGETLFQLGQYPEAVKALSRTIDLQNDYALAYLDRGLSYVRMGEEHVEQAIKDGQMALDLGDVPLHSILGLAKSVGIKGALPAELAMIKRIIVSAPDFPEGHLELGITLAHLHRYPEALVEFDSALGLGLDTARLHRNRGLTLVFLGRFDDAIIAQTRVIDLQPDDAVAYMARARTFDKLKRPYLALADRDRARDLDSGNAKVHLARALTLAHLGQYSAALAGYDQAIDLDRNCAKAYYEKAMTLCIFARNKLDPERASLLGHAMKSLEAAVAIDNNIIGDVKRKMWTFEVLRDDLVYAPHFAALLLSADSQNNPREDR